MKQKRTYQELKKENELLRQQQQILHENANRFNDIAENALEWIWEVDKDGRYTYSSPVVKAILGYGPEEVLGKHFSDFFHPKDKDKISIEASKAFDQRLPFRKFINQNVHKDGNTKVFLLTSGIPVFDSEGVFSGYRGADMDVTEQHMAKKALQESEGHLKSLMLNAKHYAVYRLKISNSSPHGLEVVFVSPSIIDIMGVDNPKKFETWFENIHADDRERIIKANLQAFETNEFNEIMKINHPNKKEPRWIHSIAKGIFSQNGERQYVNGIIIDITERKLVEEALIEKEAELESKTNKLEEINVALNVLLEKREEDKILLQEQVLSNVKKLALPYVEKLKKGTLTETQIALLDVIESSLHEIISPFSLKLSSNLFGLTPTEIKVASLIRQGKGTKEIATIRNLAHKTVARHRENIRNKLGIKNKKVNLQSHLTSLA